VEQGARRSGAWVACASVAAALALEFVARPAFAAGDDKAPVPASGGVDATGQPTAPSAQQLADRAYALHAAGNYAAAIATYLRAYEASSAGVILLNVATIYDRKLHEPELATEYYRRYLRAPDAEPDLVQKATERLTALKQATESAPEARRKTEPETRDALAPASTRVSVGAAPVDTHPPLHPRAVATAGVVVGASGLASIGASMILGLVAKAKNDSANAICDGAACSSSRGVRLAHEAGSLATASTVMFVAGLGFTGGGLAMLVLGSRGGDTASARLAFIPSLGRAGAGLDLRGGF
jgi:tetratricopeptide (TPR) repeat protein